MNLSLVEATNAHHVDAAGAIYDFSSSGASQVR
jgi:hypothetical protein